MLKVGTYDVWVEGSEEDDVVEVYIKVGSTASDVMVETGYLVSSGSKVCVFVLENFRIGVLL